MRLSHMPETTPAPLLDWDITSGSVRYIKNQMVGN